MDYNFTFDTEQTNAVIMGLRSFDKKITDTLDYITHSVLAQEASAAQTQSAPASSAPVDTAAPTEAPKQRKPRGPNKPKTVDGIADSDVQIDDEPLTNTEEVSPATTEASQG